MWLDDEDDDEVLYSGFGSISDLSGASRRKRTGLPLGFDLTPYGVDHHPDEKAPRRAHKAPRKRRRK